MVGAGAGAGGDALVGLVAGVETVGKITGVGTGVGVGKGAGTVARGGGADDAAANADDDDDEAVDDASSEEEVCAVVEPVTPFIDGDVVSRKSGGSIGTIVSTYFAPPLEGMGISLAYSVRWEQDGTVEANMYHTELQKTASGRRNVVRDFKALAQYGRRRK
jgi:hypothetical protein